MEGANEVSYTTTLTTKVGNYLHLHSCVVKKLNTQRKRGKVGEQTTVALGRQLVSCADD